MFSRGKLMLKLALERNESGNYVVMLFTVRQFNTVPDRTCAAPPEGWGTVQCSEPPILIFETCGVQGVQRSVVDWP